MDPATFLILGIALGVLSFSALSRIKLGINADVPLADQGPIPSDLRHLNDYEIGGELALFGPEPEIKENFATLDSHSGAAWGTCPHQSESPPEKQLPGGYGDNRIIALVRDPYWLFAYWEVNSSRRQEISAELGPEAWDKAYHVLRVYELGPEHFNGLNAESFFDIGVGTFTGSWHIPVGRPNHTYCIDRGMITSEGRFVVLARSNLVTTPADQVSSLYDEDWMLVSELDRQLYQRMGRLPLGTASPTHAFSQLLDESLSRLAWGVSSPLWPRSDSGEKESHSASKKEFYQESGILRPDDLERLLTPLNLNTNIKPNLSVQFPDSEECSLSVVPADKPDNFRVALKDSRSSIYSHQVEKIRKE